ncbi:MAG: hypothetical protein CEO19_322 [Parcubacteria group bacterium Gr01-1014_73]|nr:MAG: hypothetical protein CEO19_322 [Parcubacteria group bacterium Gr01-1014_73]
MKKRHSVKSELYKLEEEYFKHKPHLAAIIHQVNQLIDPETSLEEEQFIEVLHLLSVEAKNKRSVGKVVPKMATLINGLYQTHLLIQLFNTI